MRKKGKKYRIKQLEVKYDMLIKEMQNWNVWRRKHLLKNIKECPHKKQVLGICQCKKDDMMCMIVNFENCVKYKSSKT